MHNYLKRMYLAGLLPDAGLDNAVTRGWITAAEAAQIRAAKSPESA